MHQLERFVVADHLLRRHPEDAVRIVRLGALANAITSTVGLIAGSLASSGGRQRDALQGTLILVSYFKEVVELIDHHRPWELIQKAVAAGFHFSTPVSELRSMFSRGKSSFYKRRAIAIRNKKGFHVDPDHFSEWLGQLQAPYVTLWHKDGPAPIDRTFTASAQIQSFLGQRLDRDDFELVQNITVVPTLVEAIACGLLLEDGLDPRNYYVELSRQIIRIDYTFNDGREGSTERISLLCDKNGFLEGVLSELRDHVTRRFGGRRAGALLGGPEDPVLLSSPFGNAYAKSEGSDSSTPAENADKQTVLLRQMAEAGKRAVDQALEMGELLRKMRAPMAELEARLQELRTMQEWWNQKLRYAESLGR